MEQGHSEFQSVCTCASNDRGKGKCLHFASFDLCFVFFPYQCAVPPISLLPTVTQQRGKWGVAAGGSLAGGLHWQVKVGLCIGKVQQHVYYEH